MNLKVVILGLLMLFSGVFSAARNSKKTQRQTESRRLEKLSRFLQFSPMDMKAPIDPPQAFSILSPTVNNPNMELNTYGDLTDMDLRQKTLVDLYSTKEKVGKRALV